MSAAPGDLDRLAEMLERGDPDRFRALLAAPPAARPVLLPIWAFNLEVARAPYASAEPMIAEMRLQFWRDALEEIAQGGPVRRHQIATPLAGLLDAEGAQLLDAAVAARRWECHRAPFENGAHLAAHVEAVSGGVVRAAVRALGAGDPAPVSDFAAAAGRAALLAAVPALEALGRRPLDHGATPEAVVLEVARDGQAALARARAARRAIPQAARPALLSGWRTKALLHRAAARPGRVRAGGLAEAEAVRRLTLLRAAMVGPF